MTEQPFNAADWLRRFGSAGGWYVVQGDKVHAGWEMSDNSMAARAIWREIEHSEERRAAIRATVLREPAL